MGTQAEYRRVKFEVKMKLKMSLNLTSLRSYLTG